MKHPLGETESEDSDDIEVVSVSITDIKDSERIDIPTKISSSSGNESEFLWSELSNDGDTITIESLSLALNKYEVIASEEQISDMIKLLTVSQKPTLSDLQGLLKRL
jgi:hypothetical protein